MPWQKDHRRLKPGDIIYAKDQASLAETADWTSRLSVVPPLELISFGGGPCIRLAATVGGIFYCNPSGSIAGASGTWPSLTPGTTTADIYQDQGGTLVKVASLATIQNWYPAATTANHVILVLPNGYGQYDVIAQSCT